MQTVMYAPEPVGYWMAQMLAAYLEKNMDHGDRKQIIAEDGSIYEVEVVHIPNMVLTHVLVVNEEMKAKAARLLPFAQKMAKARATRASFYQPSERSLDVYGWRAYAQAEEAAHEAQEQAEALFLVAKGVASEGKRIVTVEVWRKIMACFHQDVTLGSIDAKG